MGTILTGTISGHTLLQYYLEMLTQDVTLAIIRSRVSLEVTSLALVHIVIMLMIAIILSGATKPSNDMVMKHSTDN